MLYDASFGNAKGGGVAPPPPPCPGGVFAKCLLNFGLRLDRPAGYVTASQWETGSSGQWRVTSHNGGAHCSLLGGHQGADTVRFFGYQKFYIIIIVCEVYSLKWNRV